MIDIHAVEKEWPIEGHITLLKKKLNNILLHEDPIEDLDIHLPLKFMILDADSTRWWTLENLCCEPSAGLLEYTCQEAEIILDAYESDELITFSYIHPKSQKEIYLCIIKI
jgi:hypothetical protein